MSRTTPAAVVDPGLQPERTTLAWGRTLLALVICGVLFLRWLPEYGWFAVALAAAALAAALGIYVRQRLRYRRERAGLDAGELPADVTSVLWTAVAVVGVAVAGVGAVLFSPPHG